MSLSVCGIGAVHIPGYGGDILYSDLGTAENIPRKFRDYA